MGESESAGKESSGIVRIRMISGLESQSASRNASLLGRRFLEHVAANLLPDTFIDLQRA